MPKFKPNTSSAMKKRTPYKMSGYSYPGTSPMKQGELINIKGTSIYRNTETGEEKVFQHGPPKGKMKKRTKLKKSLVKNPDNVGDARKGRKRKEDLPSVDPNTYYTPLIR